MSFIQRADDDAGDPTSDQSIQTMKMEKQGSSIFDSMSGLDLKRVSKNGNKRRSSDRNKEKEKGILSTRNTMIVPEHTITISGMENNEEEIVDVFDQWTVSQMREALHGEPLVSRLYRKIALIAGIVRPLNEKDYQNGLHKEFKGNYEEFDARFFNDKMDKMLTGYQLNCDQLPFDANHLFKDSSIIFLIGCILLYFLVLSALFATWGWASNCFDQDSMTYWNALPFGFLLLSGVGDQILSEENTTVCLWMNSLAILIGVYLSLPVLGAFILVRLLDDKADVIKLSSTMLLTMRNGIPTIQIRTLTAHGRFIPNFTALLTATILVYDSDMDETYITAVRLKTEHSLVLGFFPMLIKHTCDENSPLRQNSVVEIDEGTGLPHWNRSKIMALTVMCNADGARTSYRRYQPNKTSMIDPDEKGRLPSFLNSTPVMAHHWKKYAGKVSMVNDMSKLSTYKYSDVEYRKKDL